jgi:hypothetical protein
MEPSPLSPIHAADIDRAAVAGYHGSLKIPPPSVKSMDRVSEPASPRGPTRIQSIDRAATLLTAIAEALEGDTLPPGLCRRPVQAANEIEALLR